MRKKKIILYDGECRLCNSSVRFIRKHDREMQFTMLPLKSEEGRKYASGHHIDVENPHSVLLLENDTLYDQSAAGLRILESIRGTRWLAWILNIFPKKFSDAVYNYIAKYRYRIFGKIKHPEKES